MLGTRGGSQSRTVSLVVKIPWDPGYKLSCPPEPGNEGESLSDSHKNGITRWEYKLPCEIKTKLNIIDLGLSVL